MNTRSLILVGVAVLLVTAGFLLFSNNANQNKSEDTTATSTPISSPTSSPSAKLEEKITVTKNGFEPKMLKVKTGTKVIWENKSGRVSNVSSDPHPTHTLFPFLNLGNFENGSSVSATFDKVGVYTYHNHLDALQTGTVIVE